MPVIESHLDTEAIGEMLDKTSNVLSLVVTYNGEKYIRRCLRNLLSSNESGCILAIDNDSTDSTRQLIQKEFPEVFLLHSNENLGFGKANNIGMEIFLKSPIPYLFLVNQDVYVTEHTTQRLVAAMELDKSIGVTSPIHLAGDGMNVDSSFKKYLSHADGLMTDYVLEKPIKDLYKVGFANAAAWMMNRNCLESIGGFDPIFPHYGEDYDYTNRLKYHSVGLAIMPSIKIIHDRPQVRSNDSFAKLHKRFYIQQLVAMKNVNCSTPKFLLSFFCLSPLKILKRFLGFREIRSGGAAGLAWLKCLYQLPKIMMNRRFSKLRGTNFLLDS